MLTRGRSSHPQSCTEDFLAASGMNYTVLRLCGFMQVRAAGAAARATPTPPRVLNALLLAAARGRKLRAGETKLLRWCLTFFWICTPPSSGRHWQLRGPDPGGPPRVGHQRRDAHRVPRHPGAQPYCMYKHMVPLCCSTGESGAATESRESVGSRSQGVQLTILLITNPGSHHPLIQDTARMTMAALRMRSARSTCTALAKTMPTYLPPHLTPPHRTLRA